MDGLDWEFFPQLAADGGATGATGPAGHSPQWFYGEGPPQDYLGVPGDFYLDGASGQLYRFD